MNTFMQPAEGPLLRAIRESDESRAVFLILQGDQDINECDVNGQSCLLHAVSHGLMRVVVMLVDMGADLDAKNTNDYTPLMCAIQSKRDVLHLLITSGANFEIKNKYGETALDMARKNKNTESIKILEDAPALQQKFRTAPSREASTAIQTVLLSRHPSSTVRARPTW